MQSGGIKDPAAPPFATSGGMPSTPASSAGGGRDFTKENRPQSEAKPEVKPNPQSIPSGGPITKVGPGKAAPSLGGYQGVQPAKKPFKGI